MKTSYTFQHNSGLKVPYSSLLLGKLCEAFKIKGILDNDLKANKKTIQGFWTGKRNLEHDDIVAIVKFFTDNIVPKELAFGQGILKDEDPLSVVVNHALKEYLSHWDQMALALNQGVIAFSNEQHMNMCLLRLPIMDVGLRLGALKAIHTVEGKGNVFVDDLLNGKALKSIFTSIKNQTAHSTWSEFANHIGINEQNLFEWFKSGYLPTDTTIASINRKLDLPPQEKVELNWKLRFVSAFERIKAQIKSGVGDKLYEDLMDGLQQIVDAAHDYLIIPAKFMPEIWLQSAIWEVVAHGARCNLATSLLEGLSLKTLPRMGSMNQEDFKGLSNHWVERLQSHFQELNLSSLSVEEHKSLFPPEMLKEMPQDAPLYDLFFKRALEMRLCFGRIFITDDHRKGTFIKMPQSPMMKYHRQLQQAEEAASLKDYPKAFGYYEKAITIMPADPTVYFKYGGSLFTLGREMQNWESLLKAKSMCEKSVELCKINEGDDDLLGNAQNEIGSILNMMGLMANIKSRNVYLELAEKAFEKAEKHLGESSHHWLCRGYNDMCLENYQSALQAFDKVEKFHNNKDFPAEFHIRKYQTYLQLGMKRKASALRNKLIQLGIQLPV